MEQAGYARRISSFLCLFAILWTASFRAESGTQVTRILYANDPILKDARGRPLTGRRLEERMALLKDAYGTDLYLIDYVNSGPPPEPHRVPGIVLHIDPSPEDGDPKWILGDRNPLLDFAELRREITRRYPSLHDLDEKYDGYLFIKKVVPNNAAPEMKLGTAFQRGSVDLSTERALEKHVDETLRKYNFDPQKESWLRNRAIRLAKIQHRINQTLGVSFVKVRHRVLTMEAFKVSDPTRADLAGGTLDLWPLYCLTGGARTINVALDLTQTVHFQLSPGPFRLEIHSPTGEALFLDRLPDAQALAALSPSLRFPVTVITHYLSQKPELPERRFHIRIESKVPVGSGLGGSSVLCVALARGMARVFNDYLDQRWQWGMLDWVKDMEAAFLRTPTGTQDYLAALFGGFNCFQFSTGGIERQPYPEGVYRELSDRMLILFSGEMHQSGISNWELFKGAFEGNESILQGMRAVAQVAAELDAELRVGTLNWKYIGRCLDEEWKVRRHLFRVETRRLEEILAFLHGQKVFGAKVCGAAQGEASSPSCRRRAGSLWLRPAARRAFRSCPPGPTPKGSPSKPAIDT